MEVANLSIAIASPVFSTGAEEAHKENAQRESIPRLPQSESSAKQGPAGGDTTSGTNSSLYAQSQALVQNATEQNQHRDRDKSKKDKKEDPKLEATGRTKASSANSTISAGISMPSARSNSSAVSQQENTASARHSFNKIQESEQVHAKYSAAISEELSSDEQKHLTAIARRYNNTAYIRQKGLNIDDSI